MQEDDKPADDSAKSRIRAFTVIPGDGPGPQGHLVRHPDGFVCLNLAFPRRARLRLVDESYEPESIPEKPAEYPRF